MATMTFTRLTQMSRPPKPVDCRRSRRYTAKLVAGCLIALGLVATASITNTAAAIERPVTAPTCGDFGGFATGEPDSGNQRLSWSATRVDRTDAKFSPGDDTSTPASVIDSPHPGWYSAPTGTAWIGHQTFATGTHKDADGDGNLNEGSVWGVPITGATGDWVAIEFSTSFTIATERETSTVLTIDFSVDDSITDIRVNDVSQGPPPSTSDQRKEVVLTGPWLAGENTVTFVMESGPDWGGFLVIGATASLSTDVDNDTVLDCDDTDTNTTPYEGLEAHEADIVRLYKAAFGRQPDAAGFDYWVQIAESGYGLEKIADHFISAPEFQATFDQGDDGDFIESLYNKLFYRLSDPSGKAYWLTQLGAGYSRSDLVRFFSESPEFSLN